MVQSSTFKNAIFDKIEHLMPCFTAQALKFSNATFSGFSSRGAWFPDKGAI